VRAYARSSQRELCRIVWHLGSWIHLLSGNQRTILARSCEAGRALRRIPQPRCLKKEHERNAHPPALPLRRAFFPPKGSPPLDTLAAQFAPQHRHAEQSETEQGKCRTCIGNACSDVQREVLVRSSPLSPYVGAGRHAEAGECGVVIGRGARQRLNILSIGR
jgi:hypothetical protein